MCCINTTETPKTEDRKEIIMKKQLKKTVSLGLAAVMALGPYRMRRRQFLF